MLQSPQCLLNVDWLFKRSHRSEKKVKIMWLNLIFQTYLEMHLTSMVTRMHSTRMRTARSSSRLLEGGVCLSACWDPPPWAWTWPTPLGVGLETPLGVGLETLWCGPGDPTPLAKPPNIPPGCGPGDPHPVNRILDTHFWKYYLALTSLRAVKTFDGF